MDSVPEHMPDGTSTAAELVEAGLLSFCKSAVGGGQVALFGKLGTCLGYALLSNNGDPAAANKAGMIGLCDILSVATCSYFLTTDGYLDPTECTESEENPGLCSFAGPG